MSAYNKHDVRKMEALPDEEKTEDVGLDWHREELMEMGFSPDDLWYGDNPLIGVTWWFDRVLVWYDTNDENPNFESPDTWVDSDERVPGSWDYIHFGCESQDDGTIVLTKAGVGLMTYDEVFNTDTNAPHAKQLRPIYNLLESLGMDVKMEDAR